MNTRSLYLEVADILDSTVQEEKDTDAKLMTIATSLENQKATMD